MKLKTYHLVFLILLFAAGLYSCSQQATSKDLGNYDMEEISSTDLKKWSFYGLGSAYSTGSAFCIAENDSTAGAMIISPIAYEGDVIIRYKTMALTSSTVLVVIISASDKGTSQNMTIPENYDGSMSLWTKEMDNYFFAFRNGPHNFPPFIRKYPEPGNDALVTASENFMLPGVYYDIELGRIGNKLWLTVDGNKIIETTDEEILPGGHIAFRVRGTANFKAACLIKDLQIYSH